VIALVFFAAGTAGVFMARARLRERPPLLAGTVAELAKDRERLIHPAAGNSGKTPDA
jgi:uncharacterized membrane protein YqjE